MDVILKIIEFVEGLFDIGDRLREAKRGKSDLRVAFHIRFTEDCVPVPEVIVVNHGEHTETVEQLFADVGIVRADRLPVFVKWGEEELPRVLEKSGEEGCKTVIALADHGVLVDIARNRNIRFGVITEMGDEIVSEKRISDWEYRELRRAVHLDR